MKLFNSFRKLFCCKCVCVFFLGLIPVVTVAERVASVMYYHAPKDAATSAFVYQSAEGATEVSLERWRFSEPFALGQGAIRISFLPNLILDSSEMPRDAPSLVIPEEWQKVLILVSQDPTNRVMPIKLRAIDASDSVFGPGELLFINFTETAIFGLVGEQKLLLKSNTSVTLSDPLPVGGHGDYAVKLDSVVDTLESRRFFIRQTWRHNSNIRRLVFITPKARGRGITYYTVPVRDF